MFLIITKKKKCRSPNKCILSNRQNGFSGKNDATRPNGLRHALAAYLLAPFAQRNAVVIKRYASVITCVDSSTKSTSVCMCVQVI